MKVLPEVNSRKCKGCTQCANNCPNNVFTIVTSTRKRFILYRSKPKILVTSPHNCTGCNKCVVSCRHQAISLLQLASE